MIATVMNQTSSILENTEKGINQVGKFVEMNNNSNMNIVNMSILQWIVIVFIVCLISLLFFQAYERGKMRSIIDDNATNIIKSLAKTRECIENDKEYTHKDVNFIIPMISEVILGRAFHAIQKIIKTNHLTTHQEQIENRIGLIVEDICEGGRAQLSREFSEEILQVYFFNMGQLKDAAIRNIKKTFRETTDILIIFEKEKNNLVASFQNGSSEENIAFLYKYNKLEVEMKNEYIKLEEDVWQIFEKSLIETRKRLSVSKVGV